MRAMESSPRALTRRRCGLSHRLSWRVFSIRSASETPSLSGLELDVWAGQTLPAWAEGRKDVTAVSEPAEIFSRLETFVEEQNRRFDVMHEAGSNNLPHYNAASAAAGRDLLPFRMFFIEDLPGTVSRLGHTFLDKLCYAARYGRACGMLPYVCTQNPAPEGLPALLPPGAEPP